MSNEAGPTRHASSRNIIFAAIFIVISAAMGFHAWRSMKLGTLDDMGPGFFPLMLSVALALLALATGFTALPEDAPALRFARLRSIVLVLGSPLVFAASVRTLGLLPAVFLTIFVVSFASRFATLKQSLALSAGFTAFCVLVFSYLLNMPIPIWGSLLSF
jgi:hypothetical protein